MTILKIKDNSTIKKENFCDIHSITVKIADKTLEQLEKEGVFVFPQSINDSKDLTKEQIILQSINKNYHSNNIMGFLGYGKERLVIESRFSKGDNDYLFQYLLERVLNLPNILDLNTDANQDDKLFNLLLFLFPYYLKAAMRKGPFKTYICNKYNDGNFKGTIDIARHIQKNIPFVGHVAYNQREFSFDNHLMEIIRHTIEFIRKKYYGNKLLRKVKNEVDLIINSTPSYEYYARKKIIAQNKKNPIRHAYYHEYRNLQRLCIMILQHNKHQIGVGIQQIHGILFDGAWLWEEYINSLIGNAFYHPMNRNGGGAQWLFSTTDGKKLGLIYPDFISKDSHNRVIIDAKYKPSTNIGNKDYLQVLAYMLRFDAKRGFYLYPECEKVSNLNLKVNQGSTYEKNVVSRDNILVTKCGLHIPSGIASYEDFVKKIQLNEQNFLLKFMPNRF